MRPPQSPPSRVMALSHRERRRALLVASARTMISVVIIGGLYFVLPFRGYSADTAAVTRLAIGVVAFGLVMYGQVDASPDPGYPNWTRCRPWSSRSRCSCSPTPAATSRSHDCTRPASPNHWTAPEPCTSP